MAPSALKLDQVIFTFLHQPTSNCSNTKSGIL